MRNLKFSYLILFSQYSFSIPRKRGRRGEKFKKIVFNHDYNDCALKAHLARRCFQRPIQITNEIDKRNDKRIRLSFLHYTN